MHMKSHSKTVKRAPIEKDKETSTHRYVRGTHATLSEPEESMSSGVDSFDEDDMYPGAYHDEAVSDSLDSDRESKSPSEKMVCGTFRI
jgi:hypothetical protein